MNLDIERLPACSPSGPSSGGNHLQLCRLSLCFSQFIPKICTRTHALVHSHLAYPRLSHFALFSWFHFPSHYRPCSAVSFFVQPYYHFITAHDSTNRNNCDDRDNHNLNKRNDSIPLTSWTDSIALLAQISPQQTLAAILSALAHDNDGRLGHHEGIEALYAFADVDLWLCVDEFFGTGKKMDLGQYERFKRVMIGGNYSTLLGHRAAHILSSIWVQPDQRWVARVLVQSHHSSSANNDSDFLSLIHTQAFSDAEAISLSISPVIYLSSSSTQNTQTFEFHMIKKKFGSHHKWMVEKLLV